MEEKNLTPAEELKNQIDSAIETKANEVSEKSADALEAKAEELNNAIEEKAEKSDLEMVQKSIDDFKAEVKSNNTKTESKMDNTFKSWLNKAAQGALEAKDASFVSKNTSTYSPSAGANSAPSRDDRQMDIEFDPHQMSLAGYLIARSGNGGAYRLSTNSSATNNSGVKAHGAPFGKTELGVADEYVPYRTIGHILTVPREELNDTDMLQSYFQEDLAGYLQDALNSQILTGTGAGANIKGIEAWSAPKNEGAFDTFFGGLANGYTGANEIDVLNASRQALEGDNFMGQKVAFVHPETIAKIQGQKASDGHYILNSATDPTGKVRNFLGGIELIANAAVTAGEFYLYDVSALKFITREGMSTEIGYTGDDWERNNVSLKVYGRFAVVSGKPNGIVNGTFADAILSLNA